MSVFRSLPEERDKKMRVLIFKNPSEACATAVSEPGTVCLYELNAYGFLNTTVFTGEQVARRLVARHGWMIPQDHTSPCPIISGVLSVAVIDTTAKQVKELLEEED